VAEVLLATLVIAAGLVVARRVLRRRRADGSGDGLGRHVLVAVSRPASAATLGRLAASVARGERGRVSPLTVLTLDAATGERSRADETVERCASLVTEVGPDAEGIVRVDASVPEGLFHGAIEYDASSVVLGWPRNGGPTEVAAAIEGLVARLPVPALVARLDGYRWHRIVLRVPSEPTSDGLRASLRLATRAAEHLGESTGLQVACTSRSTILDGSPSQLVIVPVEPDPAAVRRAAAMADFVGDVVLAICHGGRVLEHRPLLPSAADLYDPRPTSEPAPAGALVRTQEH
jgi:hypothetical protein